MQSDKPNNIDKLLKSSLGGLTAKTREQDWIAIMDHLNRIEGKASRRNRKRILYLIFSICLITLLVSGGYFVLNKNRDISNTPVKTKNNTNLKASQPNIKSGDLEKEKRADLSDENSNHATDNDLKNKDVSLIAALDKEEIKNTKSKPIIQNIADSKDVTTERSDNNSLTNAISNNQEKKPDALLVTDTEVDNTIGDRVSENTAISQNIQTNISGLSADSVTTDPDNDRQVIENNSNSSKKDIGLFDSSYSDSFDKSNINSNDTEPYIPNVSIDIINRKGVTFSFLISPNLSFDNSSIRPELSEQVHKAYETISNESARGSYGYSLGVGINYKFTSHISVQTGINYTSITQNNEYNYEIGDIPVIDSKTNNIILYIQRPNPISVVSSTSNKFDYIEVPISIRIMTKINSKFGIAFSMGINSQISNNTQGQVISTQSLNLVDLNSNKNIPIRPLNLEGNIGIGIISPIRKNMILAIEPGFRKQFYSVYEDEYPIQTKNNSFGLSATVLWKFKLKNN